MPRTKKIGVRDDVVFDKITSLIEEYDYGPVTRAVSRFKRLEDIRTAIEESKKHIKMLETEELSLLPDGWRKD